MQRRIKNEYEADILDNHFNQYDASKLSSTRTKLDTHTQLLF